MNPTPAIPSPRPAVLRVREPRAYALRRCCAMLATQSPPMLRGAAIGLAGAAAILIGAVVFVPTVRPFITWRVIGYVPFMICIMGTQMFVLLPLMCAAHPQGVVVRPGSVQSTQGGPKYAPDHVRIARIELHDRQLPQLIVRVKSRYGDREQTISCGIPRHVSVREVVGAFEARLGLVPEVLPTTPAAER